MKIRHKVNYREPASYVEPKLDERYEQEIASALRKARKEWVRAQKALERAERVVRRKLMPETVSARDEARAAVETRFKELRELELLMQQAPGATGSNRSGSDSVRFVHGKGTKL